MISGKSPWKESISPLAENAAVVLVFQDPENPTSSVTLYNGYFEVSGGMTTFNVPPGTRRYTSITADNQVIPGAFKKSVSYKNGLVSTILQQGNFNGVDPSIASKATTEGSLADTDTVNLPSIASTGATLTWNLESDCVSWNAMVFTTATS